jgi:hypothetical protein
MAARSSGTGVIVSLVVFVLCTVFLLILSIVFYAGKREAEQESAGAAEALERYVTRAQRNDDFIKGIEGEARPASGDSVVKILLDRRAAIMKYVAGDPNKQLDALKNDFQAFRVTNEAGGVQKALASGARELRNQSQQIESLQATVAQRDAEIASHEERASAMQEAHERELAAVRQEVDRYEAAVDEYRVKLQEVQGEYYAAKDRLEDEYRDTISRLEKEKDQLSQDAASLRGRVAELLESLRKTRPRPDDPAILVDGRIIEAASTAGQVFIDRGRNHRIVVGMTFEVYDDAAALLQIDPVTYEVPRGKASLEVIKVADNTSTCKITRAVPGRPVVREDVIANAVYDPNYTFKFVVHGKFDLNGDGRPSEAEAQHLRDKIVHWGAEIVSTVQTPQGERLPGDVDFLVLGVQPPDPGQLRDNPSPEEIEIWVGKRRAIQKYEDLFKQARDAQVPLLNANRLLILIGDTGR